MLLTVTHQLIPRQSCQRGFTLIEVLLAMSITAITAVMAYQAMDSAGRLAEVAQETGNDLQELSSAMNLIASDFRHVSRRKVRDPEGGINFKRAFEYNEFALPMLALTRTGKVNPQVERFQRDHLERVHYQLEDQKLVRSSWAMVDHYDNDEPQSIVLFRDVESFTIEIIKLVAGSGTPQVNNNQVVLPPRKVAKFNKWPDEAGRKGIPDGVTITIETKRWGKINRTFEFVGSGL